MADSTPARLPAADRMRAHQRQWLQDLSASAREGSAFLLCNSDEFEEIAYVMGIPALVINYWNFVLTADGRAPELARVLKDRGYPGPHFFSLGYAEALHRERVTWGGIPKPTLLIGSSRNDYELRVCELWANELGSPWRPLDFNFASPARQVPSDDWWRTIRSGWEELVDPDRLAFRVEQNREMIAWLEERTGRRFSTGRLEGAMQLLNRQMDVWAEAQAIIAEARPCPVSFRDQLAMYQAMWHRGSPEGLAWFEAFRDDLARRARTGEGGYRREVVRLMLWSNAAEPRWHRAVADRYGAVIVASPYSAMPTVYARETHGDPLGALSARHLFLFQLTPGWMIEIARRQRCDTIVALAPDRPYPSVDRQAAEAAGIPFLSIPADAAPADAEAQVGAFLEQALGVCPRD